MLHSRDFALWGVSLRSWGGMAKSGDLRSGDVSRAYRPLSVPDTAPCRVRIFYRSAGAFRTVTRLMWFVRGVSSSGLPPSGGGAGHAGPSVLGVAWRSHAIRLGARRCEAKLCRARAGFNAGGHGMLRSGSRGGGRGRVAPAPRRRASRGVALRSNASRSNASQRVAMAWFNVPARWFAPSSGHGRFLPGLRFR